MAEGFGVVVNQSFRLYWCEDFGGGISHSEILKRLGWEKFDMCENTITYYVRVQFPRYKANNFEFDESEEHLPKWVTENKEKIQELCSELLEKYKIINDEYIREVEKIAEERDNKYMKERSPKAVIMNTQLEEMMSRRSIEAERKLVEKCKKIGGYVSISDGD